MPKTKTFHPDEFLFDLYAMSREEVEEMLFKEFDKIEPNFEKIKVIIDSGLVDVNAKNNGGRALLHEACLNDNIECAKLLLDAGADVKAKDDYGQTPLYFACLNDNLECAELLIDAGADVGAKDRFERTPLDLAQSNEMRALLGGGL